MMNLFKRKNRVESNLVDSDIDWEKYEASFESKVPAKKNFFDRDLMMIGGLTLSAIALVFAGVKLSNAQQEELRESFSVQLEGVVPGFAVAGEGDITTQTAFKELRGREISLKNGDTCEVIYSTYSSDPSAFLGLASLVPDRVELISTGNCPTANE